MNVRIATPTAAIPMPLVSILMEVFYAGVMRGSLGMVSTALVR